MSESLAAEKQVVQMGEVLELAERGIGVWMSC